MAPVKSAKSAKNGKSAGKSAAFERLREAVKAGTPAGAYLFYGEESYLRHN